MTPRYRRRAGLAERVLGDDVFLAHPDTGAIYRLNATGSALWRLLARPIAQDEAVAWFRAAFPAEPAAALDDAVADLLAALVEDQLVVASGDAGRSGR